MSGCSPHRCLLIRQLSENIAATYTPNIAYHFGPSHLGVLARMTLFLPVQHSFSQYSPNTDLPAAFPTIRINCNYMKQNKPHDRHLVSLPTNLKL